MDGRYVSFMCFIDMEHLEGVIKSADGVQFGGATQSSTDTFPEKNSPYSWVH